jgi:hypothetical protein
MGGQPTVGHLCRQGLRTLADGVIFPHSGASSHQWDVIGMAAQEHEFPG